MEVLCDLFEHPSSDGLLGLHIDELAQVEFGLLQLGTFIVRSECLCDLFGGVVEQLDAASDVLVLIPELGHEVLQVGHLVSTQRMRPQVDIEIESITAVCRTTWTSGRGSCVCSRSLPASL